MAAGRDFDRRGCQSTTLVIDPQQKQDGSKGRDRRRQSSEGIGLRRRLLSRDLPKEDQSPKIQFVTCLQDDKSNREERPLDLGLWHLQAV